MFCCKRKLCLSQQNIFVMTNIVLSQQKFCHDKHTFVTTICHDKNNFVATKVKSWQVYFCRDKRLALSWQTCLSQQTHVCHDKTFVATQILVAATANDEIHPLTTKRNWKTPRFLSWSIQAGWTKAIFRGLWDWKCWWLSVHTSRHTAQTLTFRAVSTDTVGLASRCCCRAGHRPHSWSRASSMDRIWVASQPNSGIDDLSISDGTATGPPPTHVRNPPRDLFSVWSCCHRQGMMITTGNLYSPFHGLKVL